MAKSILTSYNFNQNEIQNPRLHQLATAPGSPVEGQIWYNTTSNLIEYEDDAGTKIVATKAYVDNAVTGGSIADGDKGDITVSSSGATWTIDNNAVTTAKFQQIATASILGRNTAGTGNVEVLSAATVKALLAIGQADVDGLVAALAGKAASSHTHTASAITDFATAVAATASVTANTAKVSNATHTGDVTGSTALTIASGVVSNAKLATMANATIKGRSTAGTGAPEDLTATQVKALLAIAQSDVSGLVAALAGKASTSHTHTASAITDFNTAVDTRVAAYWDAIADTDANVDTIRELLDLVLTNQSALTNVIGRYNADVGDGSSTSIAVTHSLNSLDVSVEVYRKSDGATVECDVVRTNVNVVTLGFATAPTSAQYRIVVKK